MNDEFITMFVYYYHNLILKYYYYLTLIVDHNIKCK